MKKKTTDEFIKQSNDVHGNKYDYSIVEYKGTHHKIKIICSIHGIFQQTPNHHLRNTGCPLCGNIKTRTPIEKFIKKSKDIHGNKYDYSLVKYKDSHTKIKIICKKHGIFEQRPYSHLSNAGCPKCKQSKGEKTINNKLTNLNIDFVNQKIFKDCKNIRYLPFDFYLPDYNMCIEYDGRQHYQHIEYFGDKNNFIYTKHNDKIKTNYCKDNNIDLLRIRYDENIEEKLNSILEV